MSIGINKINFLSLAKDYKLGLKDYKNLYSGGIPLKDYLEKKSYTSDILSGRTPSKFNPDYWGGEYDFITLSDVDLVTYRLNEKINEQITDEAIENNGNLVLVPNGSLIVSNAMTIGLAFINDKDVYINQNVFWIKLDEMKMNKKFLLWYFNCYVRKIFQNVYSSKYLSKQELSTINIPEIPLEKQKDFETKIKEYETQINELKKNILDQEIIVNDVFAKYFKYDKKLIYDIHKGMTYGTQKYGNTDFNVITIHLSNIKDNKYRLSARANNNTIYMVNNIIEKYGVIKVKDIISENIHRGKSPQYDEKGDVPVLKTAHIMNKGIVEEFSEFVSEDFFDKKSDAQVKPGDILLTSTGKPSIGKIAIFDGEYDAVADGHVSIIRIDEKKYNKEFFCYYIQSILGYAQLEKEFVGCTNQIELYVDSINEILIPNIDIKIQEQIVKEIKQNIYEQMTKNKKIVEIRNKIEKELNAIIENNKK